MDSDERPDPAPAEPQAAGQPAVDDPGVPSDAAPEEDEASGAAPTGEPAASDAYGHDAALVGDFTTPDVDLSHLTPSSDGDPDDEEEPPTPDQARADASPQVSEEEPA
jgi:hypothetical protein